jgi:hypothetical protein
MTYIPIAVIVLLCLSSKLQGITVACSNTIADRASIQHAVDSGGLVTLTGTCELSAGTVNVNKAVQINGTANLLASAGAMLTINVDNVSVAGLTFTGTTAVHVTASPPTYSHTGISVTHNTIRNVTNGGDGMDFDAIMKHSHVDNNIIQNIAPPGFSGATFASLGFPGCFALPSACDMAGGGITGLAGWDNSTIENNRMDLISGDGIHIAWDAISTPTFYFVTSNVSTSYNRFTRIHRISLEVQGQTHSTCGPEYNLPCQYMITGTNYKAAGNFTTNLFLGYDNTYGFSFVPTNSGWYINNTATNTNTSSSATLNLGFAMEAAGGNILIQGNVLASDLIPSQSPHGGWGASIVLGGSPSNGQPYTYTVQNNVLCTDSELAGDFQHEGPFTAKTVIQYNDRANTCAPTGHLNASSIAVTFIGSGVIDGSTQTWKNAVVSALSIKNVQYFLDGSNSAIATQEVSDVNTSFSMNKQFLYHGTLDVSHLSGTHSLTVLATDVSGYTQKATTTFTANGTALN